MLSLTTSSNSPHKTSHSASFRPRSDGSNNLPVAKGKICDPVFLFMPLRKLVQQLTCTLFFANYYYYYYYYYYYKENLLGHYKVILTIVYE
jgi:hypothetical protein